MKYQILLAAVCVLQVNAECGVPAISPIQTTTKIVGGVEAVPHSWPWQVALLQEQLSVGIYTQTCGGTLISDRWILSAGHCLFRDVGSPGKYRVKLGAHKLGLGGFINPLELQMQQVLDVSAIYIHDKYNPDTYAYDISLMKLNSPADLTKYVSPVCLPDLNSYGHTGQMSTITGWGTLDYGGNRTSTLHQVSIPIVDQIVCANSYSGDTTVDASMFCAGYSEGGKDSCQGDSGGPLVTLEGDRWLVRGVVSQGEKCGEPNFPGIYANVTTGLSWIRHIIDNY